MKIWDIASRTRILHGQKLIIKLKNETIATYGTAREVDQARRSPEMQNTAGEMMFNSNELIIYVK